ncbi:MAG: hypothetical protein H8E64_03385 [Candidatus Marinimicrobia bacterium]|nr:hypothetical protein [Candidatus Neomarinimicrobiota bacterium]
MLQILPTLSAKSTAIADSFANILRVPGDWLRGLVMAINITVARGFFILYFVLLIIWVSTLPKDEILLKMRSTGKEVNLRPYALAALTSQVIIYMIF